jgi:arginine-tRNA-protein transferase
MRRVWRRNGDLSVAVGPPRPTLEKWRLYRRYLENQHDGAMSGTAEEFARFLYATPVRTEEIVYSLGERIVGVSIADRGPSSLSSVYMFFDPEHRRRGLGSYSILWEIDYCRRIGIPYYYLGYYVADSPTMKYKGRFRPCHLLSDQRRWHALGVGDTR